MSDKTSDTFAAAYAQRSGVTVAWLAEHGREPRPCGCGDDICEGWQMVNAADYEADYAMWQNGRGPDPSRGADRR